jgi:hypothetical protein
VALLYILRWLKKDVQVCKTVTEGCKHIVRRMGVLFVQGLLWIF